MASSRSKTASPISFALFSMTAAVLLADKPVASGDGCSSASQSSSKVAKPGTLVLMMGGFPFSSAVSFALKCPHLLFLDKGCRQDMSSNGAAESAVLQFANPRMDKCKSPSTFERILRLRPALDFVNIYCFFSNDVAYAWSNDALELRQIRLGTEHNLCQIMRLTLSIPMPFSRFMLHLVTI